MPETSQTLITDINPNYHYKGMLRGFYFWRRTFARFFFQRKLGEVKLANNDCYDPKKILATKTTTRPLPEKEEQENKIPWQVYSLVFHTYCEGRGRTQLAKARSTDRSGFRQQQQTVGEKIRLRREGSSSSCRRKHEASSSHRRCHRSGGTPEPLNHECEGCPKGLVKGRGQQPILFLLGQTLNGQCGQLFPHGIKAWEK